MLFEEIGQQFVNGLTMAAIYALIAVGVSLFFGAIGVVNLAHGDVAAFAAFAALAAQKLIVPISPVLAPLVGLPIGVGVGAAVGWGLFRFAFRPLGQAPAVIGLLAAIAAGFVIRESIFNFFPGGRNPQTFASVVPIDVFEFQGIFIQVSQAFVIGSAVAVCICLNTQHCQQPRSRPHAWRAGRAHACADVPARRRTRRLCRRPERHLLQHRTIRHGGDAHN
jgi:branched-chain amino acid transport system permease protein